jgi:uncharacterized protein
VVRRIDRRLADADGRRILEGGSYGVLSTVSPDGAPYGVPLGYCVMRGAVFIHSAVEGRKLDNLARETRVSFCVVGAAEILPDQFSTSYESCVVEGEACEVFGDEKQAALEELVAKYAVGLEAEGRRYIDALRDETRVFRIDVVSLSGKARRG